MGHHFCIPKETCKQAWLEICAEMLGHLFCILKETYKYVLLENFTVMLGHLFCIPKETCKQGWLKIMQKCWDIFFAHQKKIKVSLIRKFRGNFGTPLLHTKRNRY